MACTLFGPAMVYAEDSTESDWSSPSLEEDFPAQDPDAGEEPLSVDFEELTVSEEVLPEIETETLDAEEANAPASDEADTADEKPAEIAEPEEITVGEIAAEPAAVPDEEPVAAQEVVTEEETTADSEAALSEGEEPEETDPENPDPEDPEDPEPEDPAPVSIESATVTGIIDKVYSGKKQTQKILVTLTVDETALQLSKDEDYTVSYSGNVNAGTAKVTITGIGDYTGTITRTFKIKKTPLSAVALKYSKMPYRAVPRTQTSTLKVTAEGGSGAITLERNDYKVSYSDNTNVGTAKVTVTGRGNFTGSITKKYKITPVTLHSVKLAYSSLLYTGENRTQTAALVVRAVVAGKLTTLKNGTDYKVTYKDNLNVGTATLTVTGKGNYTGSLSKSFSIVPKKTEFASLSTGSMKIRVTWKEQNVQTSGYQIQYCTSKNFPAAQRKTITVSDPSVVSKSFGNLADKQTYYLRIRTFKRSGGRNYYSDWSKTKAIRFKLNEISVTSSGKTRTVTIKNVSPADSGLKMAVWSKKNGKDDLYWYPMTKQSDGSFQAELEGSRIADTGTCSIHVYTDEDTFLSKSTCSFTAAELKVAGGKYLVHKYAKSILKSTGETLRGAYDWAVGQITYQSMVVPMTLPASGPYSVFSRQELYFIYAYENKKGNCFCYAASFYWCAKELGYDARLIEGQCQYSGGYYGPHCWVEIDVDGKTYLFDPEIQHEKGWDGYWKTYVNGPSLGYLKVRPY